MKKIIKCSCFLLIFALIWTTIFSRLRLDTNSIRFLYTEPKNSMDVIFIGSSNVYAHFNNTLAFNKYGFTTGLLSTDSMPYEMIKHLLIESQKYQNPKVYVLDLTKLSFDMDTYDEGSIRKSVDSLKQSKNRIDAVTEILTNRNYDKKDYINYYFKFLMYHNRWKNLLSGITPDIPLNYLYKGYLFSTFTEITEPQEDYTWPTKIEKLPEVNEKILRDLIKYIKENNLSNKVIFTIPAKWYIDNLDARLNYAVNILKENNLKVINFTQISDLNINYQTDLYNYNHLNVYGATKFTLYFSKYLKDNYDLPDHRSDTNYSSWASEYERFKTDFKSVTNKDFNDLLNSYESSI